MLAVAAGASREALVPRSNKGVSRRSPVGMVQAMGMPPGV